jgi:hypothetical protein
MRLRSLWEVLAVLSSHCGHSFSRSYSRTADRVALSIRLGVGRDVWAAPGGRTNRAATCTVMCRWCAAWRPPTRVGRLARHGPVHVLDGVRASERIPTHASVGSSDVCRGGGSTAGRRSTSDRCMAPSAVILPPESPSATRGEGTKGVYCCT